MNIVLWTIVTMLAPVLWGATYIITTEILPEGIPFTLAVIRCLPAGLILILICRYIPQSLEWKKLILLSFFNFACFQALLFVAAYRLPGGLAAVLGALQPLVVLGLSWLVLSNVPPWISILACICALVGMVLLIVSPMLNTDVRWDVLGLAAALFGAISMGLGTFFSKHWQQQNSPMPLLAFTGWQLVIGGIMLMPLSLFIDPQLPLISTTHYFGFIYLGLFGTCLAYLFWFKGIQKLPTPAVSALGLMSPVTAIILGWVFLGESIEGWALVGLVTVIISILIVQVSQSTQRNKVLSNVAPINQEKMI